MATFYNQASLSIGGNTVNSNTTEAELLSGLAITKRALATTYEVGGNVAYVVTVSNMGGTAYTNLTVSDNLGAYTPAGGTGVVVPLSYVDGSVIYTLDGVEQPAPTVTAVGNLEFSGINLPAGSVAMIIYDARANEFAPEVQGSQITNTASVNGGVGVGVISASATVSVGENVNLTIAKAVCPTVVSDNDEITYTIIVQNLGNIPVNATDGLIIRDVFNPALSNISVTLNGAALADTFYTYNEATGEFATIDGAVAVPAATYNIDSATGEIAKTPGVAVLTVTGTV